MNSLLKSAFVLVLLQAVAVHAALTVTNIAAGTSYTLFIKSDGSLWDMGYNGDGELGDGAFDEGTNRPTQIFSGGVIAMSTSGHSLVLKSDGSLWAFGYNGNGELGDGTTSNADVPQQIVSNSVISIAAGGSHSLFVKSDGSLWAMGNYDGDIFLNGAYRPRQTHVVPQVIISNGVNAVAAGNEFSLILKSDGSLWAFGYNGDGELGDGTFNDTTNPEQIVSSGVIAIAAGDYHSLFIKSDGSLWAMGWKANGALGDGTDVGAANKPEQIVSSGVVAIAAGHLDSLFLKSDGSLWGMGENDYGELGDGTLNEAVTPEQIVAHGVVGIATGSGGGEFSLFVKSDSSLWGMGEDGDGELGDGYNDYYESSIPEQIYPSPQPALAISVSSQTNLQFNAACQFGGTFYLLSGTNLTQPLSQWTPVWTNIITDRTNNNFNATLTNVVNSGAAQQFYILQSQ